MRSFTVFLTIEVHQVLDVADVFCKTKVIYEDLPQHYTMLTLEQLKALVRDAASSEIEAIGAKVPHYAVRYD
jgi:hypothetical protein